MKTMKSIFAAILFASFFITGCGSNGTDSDENKEEVTQEKSEVTEETNVMDNSEYENDRILTEELIFIEAKSFEGEADLAFETVDGGGVNFYVNYQSENPPEFDYSFIGEDGMTANPELVGKTFNVKFQYVDNCRTTVEGETEGSYQIITIKMK